ncbi:MAG: hypothetical protein E4H36_11905 [Spirochaetales bacterium]|nr:MAG: hypothetical protein E4H36_11905 [Spirochaetales bacterium]
MMKKGKLILPLMVILAALRLPAQAVSSPDFSSLFTAEVTSSWRESFQRRLEYLLENRFISMETVRIVRHSAAGGDLPEDPESAAAMMGYLLLETEKQLRKGVSGQKAAMETRRLMGLYKKAGTAPVFAKQGSRKAITDSRAGGKPGGLPGFGTGGGPGTTSGSGGQNRREEGGNN